MGGGVHLGSISLLTHTSHLPRSVFLLQQSLLSQVLEDDLEEEEEEEHKEDAVSG